jgi:hypothetical protein
VQLVRAAFRVKITRLPRNSLAVKEVCEEHSVGQRKDLRLHSTGI